MKCIVKRLGKGLKMKIGSHVNNNGIEMLVGSVNEAINYGASCMMIYLGAPQNTVRKPISDLRSEEALKIWKEHGNNPEDIIVHAPYIVNPASPDDEKYNFAISFLTREVIGVDLIGAKYLVLHPGAHTGSGIDHGLIRIITCLNTIIKQTPNARTVILLETMAGKGTECGSHFEEIARIIGNIEDQSRIGVCLDTCHISDAGYDIVNNYQEVIKAFDEIIGLKYLKCIHLNDSKNVTGSHKDRHENIGFGNLGFKTIMQFINDERLNNIPKILETPYVEKTKDEKYPPYKYEIAMIKEGIFKPTLKDDIINSFNE